MALWALYGMLLVLLLFIRIVNKGIGGGGNKGKKPLTTMMNYGKMNSMKEVIR